MQLEISPNNFPEIFWEWSARAIGAIIGSSVSIAYLLPRNIREAALRFLTGVGIGFVFGTMVGHLLSAEFGLEDVLGPVETTLIGATAASICAWWSLGILARIAGRAGQSARTNGT